MAKFSVTFSPALDCGKCDEVLLWLHNALLIDANVGLDPADYNPFIRAKIYDVTEISGGVFVYVIEYDETLLTDPEADLCALDIKEVCCLGCLYQWLQTTAICELIQAAPPGCFDGIAFFDLSGDAGTVETIAGGEEMRLFGGSSILTTVSAPDTVTIDLLLSGDVDQILTFGTDGHVYLDCSTVLGCINVQNPITGDGSAGAPFGIALSPDAGNSIELRGNGLYAENTDTQLTCTEVLQCINVANPISGVGSVLLPFTVDRSADAGNILELRVDGLYVPNTDTVLDCPAVLACINIENPLHGDGSGGNPFGLTLDPDVSNQLVINPGGLYSPPTSETLTAITSGVLTGGGTATRIVGARTLDYTDENGVARNFQAGIGAIETGGVANEGVGPNFMVKHISFTPGTWGNELNIRSAPEVDHNASFVGATDPVPVPLDALGLYINPIFGPYIFNNPFSDRRAAIIVGTQYQASWQRNGGNQALDFIFSHTKSTNGGAFTTVAQFRRAFSANGLWASSLVSREEGMDTVNGPLAIGGSINIRLRSTVNVTSIGPAGSQLVPQNIGVSVEFFSTR